MKVFIITYDLHEKSESNYNKVHKAIQQYANSFHCQESVWFVATDDSRETIYNNIRAQFANDDKLLIGELAGAYWKKQSDLEAFLSNYWTITY